MYSIFDFVLFLVERKREGEGHFNNYSFLVDN